MVAVAAVVPAAGRSERFGSMKLTADLHGEPLLNHTLRSLIDAGVERIIVVVGASGRPSGVSLLDDARVSTVVNPDPARGMFSSIQTGIAPAEAATILVLPADMPFVKPSSVETVAAACRKTGRPVVPAYRGRRGHPLALPGGLRAALLAADPHLTLKDALAGQAGQPTEVGLDDPGIVRDVDVPGDLDDVAKADRR